VKFRERELTKTGEGKNASRTIESFVVEDVPEQNNH
jgi:hypothetical protein